MTLYYVGKEEFTSLSAAKKRMRETGKEGEKVKVYSNGEWVPCGPITLSGSNRCHIVGTRNSNSY